MDNSAHTRMAIFASGTGSNAAKIIDYFRDVADIDVALIVSNRKRAGVLSLAEEAEIPTELIRRRSFYESNDFLETLADYDIHYIILAGFLWLIPAYLVEAFEGRMLNIHPALLPKYGGKGMYGMHVHQAVKAAGERESGISIHLVTEAFDEGAIICQKKCVIDESDSAETIRTKVLNLEHQHFAPTIERFIRQARIDSVQVGED